MSVTPGTRPDAPGPTHRPTERQRHPRKAGAMFSRTRKGLGFIRATSGGVYPKAARGIRKGSSQLESATLDLEQEPEGVRRPRRGLRNSGAWVGLRMFTLK
jgi:hypothetical protein